MFKIILKLFNLWMEAIIYVVSFWFALSVVITAIFNLYGEINFLILILGGFLGSSINFILFRAKIINLEKFYHKRYFVISILSKFITTSALIIFICKFFISEFQNIWQKSLETYFPGIIEENALLFVGLIIFLSIVFIPSLILIFYGLKINKKRKDFITKYLFIFFTFIYAIIITYSIGSFLDNKDFQLFAKEVITSVVGLIFIHWIYELFNPLTFPVKIFIYFEKYRNKVEDYVKNI